MIVHESRSEYLVLPVCTVTENRRIGKLLSGSEAYHFCSMIAVEGKFFKVQHIQTVRNLLDSEIALVCELGFSGLAPFGSNHYDTIACARAVNGGCRGVFQYFHGHDVRGVDRRQRVGIAVGLSRQWHAVHHI